jgi:hypothetical protein
MTVIVYRIYQSYIVFLRKTGNEKNLANIDGSSSGIRKSCFSTGINVPVFVLGYSSRIGPNVKCGMWEGCLATWPKASPSPNHQCRNAECGRDAPMPHIV